MSSWGPVSKSQLVNPDWIQSLNEILPPTDHFPSHLWSIIDNLRKGIPLNKEQGLSLYNLQDLNLLGYLANSVKVARYGKSVFFNSNLHVNHTNICRLACKFCAFRRGSKAKDAYSLSIAEYIERIRPFQNSIDEVHTVGGLHPDWGVEHYEELYLATKTEFPHIHIKSLTAVEVQHIATISNISITATLDRLREAGLDSLPGGGAEILNDDIRDIICKGKESSQEYLDIHCAAHRLGIQTNCTMLFGTVESPEHRIEHLISLRSLQQETNGFQCFVPYPYLPDNSRLPEAQLSSTSEILRMIALSRLMLNNIPHIKAYRMNFGDSNAFLALNYGADDVDGTVGHEEIMHEAGSTTHLSDDRTSLAQSIIDEDLVPIQRNSLYSNFKKHIDDDDDNSGVNLPMARLEV